MIFTRGFIIGASGVGFGFESAEPEAFAFNPDFGGVSASSFFEIYSDEFRGGSFPDFGPVAGVLGVSCEAEILPSVIECVVIFVVNEEAFGEIHNLSVHTDNFDFTAGDFDISEGVKFLAVAAEVPNVIFQEIIIGRLDEREFALAEVNPPI